MVDTNAQALTLGQVNNMLSSVLDNSSKCVDIIQELSKKIKFITMTLNVFSDVLSLELGPDGKNYKIKHLELLKNLMKSLGLPFIWKMDSITFVDALRVCSEDNPEVQKKVDDVVVTAIQLINFEEKIELNNLKDYAESLVPGITSKLRPPKNEFEKIVGQALKILHACRFLKQVLLSENLTREQEEQVVEILKKIESFKSRSDLFQEYFKPIECEFIAELVIEIAGLEDHFLKISKKVQKSFEIILQRGNSFHSKGLGDDKEALELHKRTRFIEGERLEADEGNTIEYKNYSYPFSDLLKKVLQKTICSFLNGKGGRLYIGIRDEDKMVCGLTLTSKDRDCLRLEIASLLENFYPNITHEDFVRVDFIPVSTRENKPIPGRVVVKIIVKQGDADEIYSISREALKCYIRKDGYCKNLDAAQIVSIIKKKAKNPSSTVVDPKEFNDPKPEKLEEIQFVSASKKTIKEKHNKRKDDLSLKHTESDASKNQRPGHKRTPQEKGKETEEKSTDSSEKKSADSIEKKPEQGEPKKDPKKKDKKETKDDKKAEITPVKTHEKNESDANPDSAEIPLERTKSTQNKKVEEFLQSLQPTIATGTHPKPIKKVRHPKKGHSEQQDNRQAQKANDLNTLENLLREVLINDPVKAKGDQHSEQVLEKPKQPTNGKEQEIGYHFKLTGLPPKVTDEEVFELFNNYKTISKPNVYRDGPKHDGDCKGFAKVKFADLEEGNIFHGFRVELISFK